MKYLVIVFLFISSFISGQGIEPTSLQPTQYQGGILRGVIPYVDEFTGETLYIYQHVDSLVFIKDSIYVRNDSIFLRDGTGFAIVTDSIYNVSGSTKDTIKLRDGEGYALVDKALVNGVKGTGTATRVAWWAKSDSLGSSSKLYFDTLNNELWINTQATIGYRLGVFNGRQYLTFGTWNPFINGGNTTLSGIGNIAIGSNQTMSSLTTGNNNVSLGQISGFSTTTGSDNLNIGYGSGYSNVSSSYNVNIGALAGYSSTGASNMYIGASAGASGGTGSLNTSVGAFSGYNGGNSNTNIGFYSGFANTGQYNVNIGMIAGQNSGAGVYNVYIGGQAGANNTGSENVAIGLNSGFTGDGSNNIFIGSRSGQSATGSGILHITNADNTNSGIFGNISGGKYGVNQAPSAMARTWDINGELRIRDLTTDAATKLLGADNDGDVSGVTVGNGLNIDAGTLSITANINGTQNRVAKFTSQYAVGNSEIYTIGDTLVGINQSNPQYHLDVTGKFRVTDRTGTAVTGAGFTSNGQLIAYSLDTASATPNTYISSGTDINITGTGTMVDPYTINNSAPENTSVKDGTQIDFSELTNDTITATIIAGSIGPTEIAPTSVTAGSYTFMSGTVDADGRLTGASSGSAVTSIATTIPITGGTITSTGTIGINDAVANGATKGASTYTTSDFNDNGSGLISIDYNNGQAASGSLKGFLTSTDWTTFNNKMNLYNGAQLYSYSINGIHRATEGTNGPAGSGHHTVFNAMQEAANYGFQIAGGNSDGNDLWYRNKTTTFGSWNQIASRSWVTSQGYMDRWGYVTPSGTGAGVTSYISDDQVITYLNGTGITIGRATGTNNVTITNTGVTSLNGLVGAMFLSTGNSGTYPNWSSSGTTLIYNLPSGSSGQVLKHNGTGWTAGTDNDTDNQTLSFSSPNLSISGGNSVALPVLPTGTATSNTLRWSGSAWAETSMLKTTTARVDINSWPGTVNLGSKLLVNGHIQYTNTGFQASTITGRDTDGGLTGVTVGSGLSLSGGTLTATDASTSNEIQTLSHSAPTLSISSGNSITLTQQYGQMSSNGGCATVSTSYGTTVSGTAIGNNVTVSSTTITVPATGTYELNYSGYFILDPTASNVGVGMRVRKNGSSTVSVTIENIQGTASTEYRAMSKNVIVSLNSGDTLVLQPTKDAGTVNLCDYVMNIIRLN